MIKYLFYIKDLFRKKNYNFDFYKLIILYILF